MLGMLILLLVFSIGFGAGYAVRHFVSLRRRDRYLKVATYTRPGPRIGHARRAF